MKFIIDNWMLIVLTLVSGTMLFMPLIQGASGSGIPADRAVQLINREKAVLIDVSEPAEFAAGHAPGSRNIPVGDLERLLPDTVKNKALPVILTCQTGARAGRVAATARKLGYEQTFVLSGGLSGWRTANLPVEKA